MVAPAKSNPRRPYAASDCAPAKSKARGDRPAKPYPEFPLFPHRNGQWAKKIKGKLWYFGRWDDHEAALRFYRANIDSIHAGDGITTDVNGDRLDDRYNLGEACNVFLADVQRRTRLKKITPQSFDYYKQLAERLLAVVPRTRPLEECGPQEFKDFKDWLEANLGPSAVGKAVKMTKTMLNFAKDTGLCSAYPDYGKNFRPPSAREIEVEKESNREGKSITFSRDECIDLLAAAQEERFADHWQAFILLGLNCGFGRKDCVALKHSGLCLETGWLWQRRTKTDITRRCPLWPETVDALIQARDRYSSPEQLELLLSQHLTPWRDSALTRGFTRMMGRLGIRRARRGYYGLRHTMASVIDPSGESRALKRMMGHSVLGDTTGAYVEIDDQTLLEVSERMRQWLWPGAEK